MADPNVSIGPDYFDMVYAANDDPWSFETSAYEAAKYAATLAALPRARYRSGFEIGCSHGVFTAQLALRCNRLLAVDVVPSVLDRARHRCRDLPHVRFAQMALPAERPDERFDLIVLSEVGYYWSLADLGRARQLLVDLLVPEGHLILVHWTPWVHDYPLTGDQVHDAVLADAAAGGPLEHLAHRRHETYRLDLFARRPISTRRS